MNETVKIENLPELDLNNILEKRHYNQEQVEKIFTNDALILPEITKESEYEILKPEVVTIKKRLSEKIKIEIIRDQKKTHKYEELLSAEIVLPIIVIFSEPVWEICKDFISSWIYDKYRSLRDRDKTPNALVKLAYINREKGISKQAKISGPSNFVSKTIKELDLKKIFKKYE